MTADIFLKVPGKLNLNDFQKVSAALQSGKRPLTASEDVDQHGYAVPKDTMAEGDLKHASEYAQPVDIQEPKPASRKPKHRERREQRTSHPGMCTLNLQNFINLENPFLDDFTEFLK